MATCRCGISHLAWNGTSMVNKKGVTHECLQDKIDNLLTVIESQDRQINYYRGNKVYGTK